MSEEAKHTPTTDELTQRLREALRFSASRSVMSAAEENAILAAWKGLAELSTLRTKLERAEKALATVDKDWATDFPEGPDGPRDYRGFGQLSDETVATWREIRTALSSIRGEDQ